MNKLANRFSMIRSIGPAIITASVVLGPGSILAASKIGYQHGYAMTWMLCIAVLMMIGMTALSARLGVMLDGTLCEELARREGRLASVVTGVSLFLIAACFQFGNNLGVLAAVEPFLPDAGGRSTIVLWLINIGVIGGLNVLVICTLLGFKHLYQPIESLMKFLVMLMLIGFAGNLLMARPEFQSLVAGLIPRLPEGAAETLLPKLEGAVTSGGTVLREARIIDHLTPVTAMFATTFSIGGAFYQSYLVRQKGWTREHLRQGFVDSTVGIIILGCLTLMIMVTAAAVLHDNPAVAEPQTAADVAVQLEPLFGQAAKILFCLGIFAGSFSSFLVNAMIGGTILSDGLGWGGNIDHRWPKTFTVVVLLVGMGVAIWVQASGQRPVNLIIFAQAITVLGLPALAVSMLYLSGCTNSRGERGAPKWMTGVAVVALVIVAFLAIRTAIVVWLRVAGI